MSGKVAFQVLGMFLAPMLFLGTANAFALEECTLPDIKKCTQSDPASAESLLIFETSKSNDAGLLFMLGEFYRSAPVPYHDPLKAAAAFEKAVAAGDAWSKLLLADMLIKGEGIASDPQRALALLESARADGIEGPAQFALGTYYRGSGDSAQAIAAFEKAVAAGDTWSKLSLADMLIKGEGIGADPQRALALLESARADGIEGPAQFALGTYYRGSGDSAQAIAAFEKAVAAGDTWSKLSLADMLIKGEGIGADPQRALALLESARADGIEGPAQFALGTYYRGSGDSAQAIAAFEKAVAAGDIWSKLSLAEVLAQQKGRENLRRSAALLQELKDSKFVPSYPIILAATAPDDRAPADVAAEALDMLHAIYSNDTKLAVSTFSNLDANFKVAAVQMALMEIGLYDHRINGRLTRNTLDSLERYCRQKNILRDCMVEAIPEKLLANILVEVTNQ